MLGPLPFRRIERVSDARLQVRSVPMWTLIANSRATAVPRRTFDIQMTTATFRRRTREAKDLHGWRAEVLGFIREHIDSTEVYDWV
jgi:hypothetical protein